MVGSLGRRSTRRQISTSLESSRSRNSSISSRKRSDSKGKGVPKRPRPKDLALSYIHSPTSPDEELVPYNQVLPILTDSLEVEQAGLSNEIIQSDPKRVVAFEPESPRASIAERGCDRPGASDRDATKIDVRLSSAASKSAIDICATPLCLDAANQALDEVSLVCQRLHYSTISTILMSRVIKAQVLT